MLILKRGLKEAVILHDRDLVPDPILVTVVEVLPQGIKLLVQVGPAMPAALMIQQGDWKDIGLGARVTMLECSEAWDSRATLGFDVSSAVRLSRYEVWERYHGG